MTYQIDNHNGRQLLRLEGNLDIESAGELKELFVNLLESVQHLDLQLDGVKTAHVACLQVMCSAHETFWALGRSLTMKGKLPPEYNKIIEESGFFRGKGCPRDTTHTCLFAKGGN